MIVIALEDSLSIRAGNIYQFREYTPEHYYRWEEKPPLRGPEGTLEGIGHCVPPCCVAYPKRYTKPLEFDDWVSWL